MAAYSAVPPDPFAASRTMFDGLAAGAENLCHQAIFVDDATRAVMPLDPEMI
jgi:hypothetical protein